MKPQALTTQKSINQQPLKCTNGLLASLPSSLRAWQFNKRAAKTKSSVRRMFSSLSSTRNNKNSKSLVLVDRAAAVLNVAAIAKAFPRVIVGLFLLVVAAPYADIFYTRLDFNDRVPAEVWYYESYHWLFLCLGPYLKSIFYTIGLYLIFARGISILSLVAAYALMFDIGKVFWLLQVDSHEEYKSLPTGWFLAYGFITGCFLILITDRLTYWLNHRVEAIKRRLHGLNNLVGKVDDRVVLTHFVQTVNDDIKVQQFKQY